MAIFGVEASDIFGEGGWLSHRLDGYVPRPGQSELADAIMDTIFDSAYLAAEAPTGTGKSLAYGFPAALYAIHTGDTVVIATANITLQEQLVNKDLPFIKDMIEELYDVELTFASVKGKGNYLCKDKIDEALDSGRIPQDEYTELSDWIDITNTGDKSELSRDLKSWPMVSTSADECSGKECPFHDECYANTHTRIKQLHILVTNYHMLYIDGYIKEVSMGEAGVLPRYSVAILDEAHEAANIAADMAGVELSKGGIMRAFSRLRNFSDPQAVELHKRASKSLDIFFEGLKKLDPDKILGKPIKPVVGSGVLDSLNAVSEYLNKLTVKADKGSDAAIAATRRLKTQKVAVSKKISQLNTVLHGDSEGRLPNDQVFYLSKDRRGDLSIASKLVNPGEYVRTYVLNEVGAAIALSATMSHDGSSVGFTADKLGMRDAKGLVVESPFDPENLLAVIPDNIAEPAYKTREQHTKDVAAIIAKVAKSLNGRTMALFTSYKSLITASEILSDSLPGFRLLIQGEMAKAHIIKEFKENTKTVILATASFWQGVDIPGDALSCVLIDKIPFVSANDPIMQKLEEALEYDPSAKNPFFGHSIPNAMIALKQGIGRLIRGETDVGAVIVCDGRLLTKGYGNKVQKSLPAECLRSNDIEDIPYFIEQRNPELWKKIKGR